MILHTCNPNQCSLTNEASTSYTLRFPRYNPDQILQVKVTMARSKVKSRSYTDIAHLHHLTNVTTKYQLPTPYGFRDIALTSFCRSKSLRQGQTSTQGQTMTLAQPMFLPSINFLYPMVSEIQLDKFFPARRLPFDPSGHHK